VFHGFLVIVITAVLGLIAPQHIDMWANLLGLMSAALAAVQYIPQIWTTYHLKHVGSLSIPMMCLQTPGGFLFAGSLFARLGWGGWSSWGIFLLTGTMQGILLVMAIYYELRAHADDAPKSPTRSRLHLGSNGYDHDAPERYASYDDDNADNLVQDDDLAAEAAPLLQPGGRGENHRNYETANGS
jgi:hypothetical protein